MHDSELFAAGIYAEARFDLALPPGPRALAAALPWITGVEIVDPTEVMGEGQLEQDGSGWRVLLSSAIEADGLRVDFVLAHELAEGFAVRHALYLGRFLERERFCDAVAAALIIPRPSFVSALAEHGEDYSRLAHEYETTETLVALRTGEVLGQGRVVITLKRAYVRGSWSHPTDPTELRRMMSRPPPGVRAKQLRDDPTRVVLAA